MIRYFVWWDSVIVVESPLVLSILMLQPHRQSDRQARGKVASKKRPQNLNPKRVFNVKGSLSSTRVGGKA